MKMRAIITVLFLGLLAAAAFRCGGGGEAAAQAARAPQDRAKAGGGPELIAQTGHTDFVKAAVYSPDGRLLATGGGDSSVRLWDPASGRLLATLSGHRAGVLSLAFSPDGGTLAGGGIDGTVKLWSVRSPGEPRDLAPLEGGVFVLSFLGDGSLVAGYDDKGVMALWDAASGKELRRFRGCAETEPRCAFSRQGTYAAFANAGGSVDVLVLPDGGRRTIPGIAAPAAFSADGRILAARGAAGLVLIDTASWTAVRTLPLKGAAPKMLCLSADGKMLGCVDAENALRVVDLGTGKVVSRLESPESRFLSLQFSPDGTEIATGHDGGTASIWGWASGIRTRVLEGLSMIVNAVAISGDGGMLACAGWENSLIKLWDLAEGTGIRNLAGHGQFIYALAFCRDGKRLVSGSADDTARVWNAGTGASCALLEGHRGGVYSVAMSPSGDIVATGDGDGVVRLWHADTGGLVSEARAARYAVCSLAFSADGRLLASAGSDGELKLWDGRSGKAMRTLAETGGERLNAVVFSPDGAFVASGGWGDAVAMHDVRTGAVVGRLTGHTAWIEGLAFAPDGRRLAGASRDHAVHLWDVASGVHVRAVKGHGGGVFSVAFGPGGAILASGSWDASVKLWTPDGTELATLLTFDRKDAFFGRAVGARPGEALMAARRYAMDVRFSQARPELELPGHNDWLVVTPEGFFDGSPGGMQKILWRFGGDLFDLAEPEQYFDEFYQPGVLRDIFRSARPIRTLLQERGDERASLVISEKDRRLPAIRLDAPSACRARTVEVTLHLAQAPPDARHPAPSGLRDVRLFRNGTLLTLWPGDRTEKTLRATIPVAAGENLITAYAFNGDNVKSKDALASTFGADVLRRAPRAFVLAIGIDVYAKKSYNLKYAAADAEALCAALSAKLPYPPRSVHVVKLVNAEATRAGICAAFAELARRAEPEDAVIVAYAGHGVNYGGRFYLVPHDMTLAKDEKVLAAGGISDRDLERLFLPFKSQATLLILDACYSGQALESSGERQGPMNSRGFAQLAWEKGMAILTASQSHQAAMEMQKLGHGLLTYALLRGFTDAPRRGGSLLSKDWLEFAARFVPRMLEEDEELRGRMAVLRGEGDPYGSAPQVPRIFLRREISGDWSVAGPKAGR